MSMRIPQKVAENIFSPENTYIVELQKRFHFFIEQAEAPAEVDERLGVPVTVFTKSVSYDFKVK